MPRDVLVIGAQGFLGSFIARALAERGWRVTRGGRRAEDAADFRLVDLDRPDTVRDACAAVDLVVSTVRHPALVAERTVLERGPILLNLDDLPAEERGRAKREAPNPSGLVVDRTGLYGVAMLALVDLLRRHPDADAVDYGFLASAAEKAGRAGGALMHRLVGGAGRHRTAEFVLPPPFGQRRAIKAGPDADSLLRDVVGPRALGVYVCFLPAIANAGILALNSLGLASRLPLSAFTAGRKKPPSEPSRQPTCHWVRVRRGTETIAARFVCGEGDYRSSVKATAVVADALVSEGGRSIPRGLFGVDEVLDVADVAPALAESGITIQ